MELDMDSILKNIILCIIVTRRNNCPMRYNEVFCYNNHRRDYMCNASIHQIFLYFMFHTPAGNGLPFTSNLVI